MEKVKVQELTIDGTVYVPKGSQKELASTDGLRAVIIRGENSGVQFGYLEKRKGTEVTLRNAIRIWYWSGAASISQLAVDGTSNPTQCKFSVPVENIEILDALEVIDCTTAAVESIQNVQSWKK